MTQKLKNKGIVTIQELERNIYYKDVISPNETKETKSGEKRIIINKKQVKL